MYLLYSEYCNVEGDGCREVETEDDRSWSVFYSRDVIEKEDMVLIFINSGRIVFEEEEEEEKEEEQEIMVEDFVHQKQSFDCHEEEVKRPRIDDEGRNHNSNYSNKVEVDDVYASSTS